MRRAKITIVGAGNVGATTAHWCAAAELGNIVLLDIPATGDMPKGKGLDLRQASPIVGFDSDIIGTTSYEDTVGSDVVVITAGIPRKPGMSRDDLLSTNAKIMTDVCEQVKRTSEHAVVIVVSNPLDAMVQRAMQVTGFEPKRVSGPGRHSRYGPLLHVPVDGARRQPEGYLRDAPGRPRRHDGARSPVARASAEFQLRSLLIASGWEKSSTAHARAAQKSSDCSKPAARTTPPPQRRRRWSKQSCATRSAWCRVPLIATRSTASADITSASPSCWVLAASNGSSNSN